MSPKTTPSASSVSAAWVDARERESCSGMRWGRATLRPHRTICKLTTPTPMLLLIFQAVKPVFEAQGNALTAGRRFDARGGGALEARREPGRKSEHRRDSKRSHEAPARLRPQRGELQFRVDTRLAGFVQALAGGARVGDILG